MLGCRRTRTRIAGVEHACERHAAKNPAVRAMPGVRVITVSTGLTTAWALRGLRTVANRGPESEARELREWEGQRSARGRIHTERWDGMP
jgi:hypothetical protein